MLTPRLLGCLRTRAAAPFGRGSVWLALGLLVCGLLAGCGPETAPVSELAFRTVTLPDGTRIRAELLTSQDQMLRGMQFRDALPEGRGLLFAYARPGNYRYWMYQVRVPLDIIWMDTHRNIVQVVHDCPPCPGPPGECKSYGGDFPAQYVLELNAGSAKKHGLKPGQRLDF